MSESSTTYETPSRWGLCANCGCGLTGPRESKARLCIPCAEAATGKRGMAALGAVIEARTRQEPANRQRIIREWIGSTEDAITALRDWLGSLREWAAHGGEHTPGDFDAAFDRLYQAGLGEGWADTNPAGGGLDALAAAVTGREV